MKLEEIFSKYPRIRLATAADNEAILNLFRTVEMETPGLRIRYERGPDFFAFLRRQCEAAYVAMFENDDGSLGGVATFCLRKNYVRGETQYAAYLSDLRLSPRLSKSTRVQWRKFYQDILQNAPEIDEFRQCRYFYSAILDQNRDAVRAFTRNKSEIIYSELAKYQTVSLLGRYPWARWFGSSPVPAGYEIGRAQAADLPAIRRFLMAEHFDRAFGENFSGPQDELDRRLSEWGGLSAESFFVVKNWEGRVVATVAPWGGQDNSRRLVVDRLPTKLRWLSRLMPLLGSRSAEVGQELKILYLTHFEVDTTLAEDDRRQIFRALLGAVYATGLPRQYHSAAFFDFPERSWVSSLMGYVFQTVPATLYQVSHRDRRVEGEPLGLNQEKPPAFEIGIA